MATPQIQVTSTAGRASPQADKQPPSPPPASQTPAPAQLPPTPPLPRDLPMPPGTGVAVSRAKLGTTLKYPLDTREKQERQLYEKEKADAMAFVIRQAAIVEDNKVVAWVQADTVFINKEGAEDWIGNGLLYVKKDRDRPGKFFAVSKAEVTDLVRQCGSHIQVFERKHDYNYLTMPPDGYIEYCHDNPKKCNQSALVAHVKANGAQKIEASEANMKLLVGINNRVNDEIKYVSDKEQYGVYEYWSNGETGKGDCEDYAIRKQELLVNRGFPREALLLTSVTVNSEAHMILKVRTTKGDFYMDSNRLFPKPLYTREQLEKDGYKFEHRQADDGSDRWVVFEKRATY